MTHEEKNKKWPKSLVNYLPKSEYEDDKLQLGAFFLYGQG